MSNFGRTPDGVTPAAQNRASGDSGKPAKGQKACVTYNDVQSAPRFPVHLPVAVKSQTGASLTETSNISANGALFQVDAEMPVGSLVDFTISLPADVVGADTDVKVDCRGRVVRNYQEDGRRGVGVVIDEYRFGRR